MAKTRRMITENLKHVDLVIEILDARIPYSSRNPEIARLTENKPTLLLLNKASLADPAQNASWVKRYTNENTFCLLTDCVTGEGMNQLAPTIKRILAEKLRRYEEKGMTG
ncbi:MAG: ribosome biogenesis GTPase YlqF, partial [Clostridia bacterium]|nr:ribosome biogenesis GTPase YlqF [Clostridia bacterium]